MATSNTSQITVDRLISLAEMASLTGRTPKTIWRWWAVEKTFPRPILKNGRCLGWKTSVYEAWLNELAGV